MRGWVGAILGCAGGMTLVLGGLTCVAMVGKRPLNSKPGEARVKPPPDPPSVAAYTPRAAADVEITSWSWSRSHDYAIVEGEIQNLRSTSIRNVAIVVYFFTDRGELVSTEDALIEYNPLLGGQVSPFKVHGGKNPAITKCAVMAKILFGPHLKTYIRPG